MMLLFLIFNVKLKHNCKIQTIDFHKTNFYLEREFISKIGDRKGFKYEFPYL
jgi:hypothetical protein